MKQTCHVKQVPIYHMAPQVFSVTQLRLFQCFLLCEYLQNDNRVTSLNCVLCRKLKRVCFKLNWTKSYRGKMTHLGYFYPTTITLI